MSTTASSHPAAGHGPMAWLAHGEDWLDARGKPAWIIAMGLGFVLFWPVGLALLFYMIWSGKLACETNMMRHRRSSFTRSRSTGNSAFDAYRDDTIARLEREQIEFESFLQRLRDARDKAEFDQFLDERAREAATPSDAAPKEA